MLGETKKELKYLCAKKRSKYINNPIFFFYCTAYRKMRQSILFILNESHGAACRSQSITKVRKDSAE